MITKPLINEVFNDLVFKKLSVDLAMDIKAHFITHLQSLQKEEHLSAGSPFYRCLRNLAINKQKRRND